MNKKLFAKLCFNFNKEPNEELFQLWEEQLKDYEPNRIEEVLKTILVNDKYFPTLSRVIELIDSDKENDIKQKCIKPEWLGKQIVNEEIDEETKEQFKDFIEYIKDFRK